MKKTTIVFVPSDSGATRSFQVPEVFVRLATVFSFSFAGVIGYLAFDYMELRQIRKDHYRTMIENEGLKGEARVLAGNLEEVKRSLKRVQDYTTKLGELTAVRVQKVTKKTGLGPLSEEEYNKIQNDALVNQAPTPSYLPLGLNVDNLSFRPIFDKLKDIGDVADTHAIDLQRLLSTLSQQKSLLSSIPSLSPVNGWITSGFGYRISPLTGKRAMHKGIDVASPVGSPIYSPADGVVIFTGAKAGFGNFVMIAHGYGIISRYGHLAENLVEPGQRVKRGEQVATVGMTGRTTGPHLHYEVVVDGRAQDPKKFILNLSDDWLAL
jgi:murein DD-endopeptidase MepM/ murein hydrolase activator NlpD